MLTTASRLRGAGIALHWLRPRDKAPMKADWANLPVATIEQLKKSYRRGYNLGVRLGEPSKLYGHYLHLIDLDIRDEDRLEEAVETLKKYLPEFDTLPMVRSGSGGSSGHYYFLSDEPFPSKKLAHSSEFEMVRDVKKGRDVKKWKWEIEFFGTGKQAVLPPSIHPNGQPYEWALEFDFDEMDMGILPIVSADRIRDWGVTRNDPTGTESKPPLGLSVDEVRAYLDDLPSEHYREDRNGWLELGMALHHEFEGSKEGYDLWIEYSRLSEKHDPKDQKRVWHSFKNKARPVRMATIVVAAKQARIEREFSDMDEDMDEFDAADNDEDLIGGGDESDLIGGGHEPKPAKEAPAEKLDTKWMGDLDLTEDEGIRPTLHNLTLIIKNDPRIRGLVQHNEFTLEPCQRRKPGKYPNRRAKQLAGRLWDVKDAVNGDIWDDARDNAIRDILEAPKRKGGYGFKVSDRDLMAAINLAARNDPFHPIKEWVEKEEWDGKERMESLFIDYMGVEDTPYHRQTAKMMMVAAVTRIYEPGHKFDFAVIIEGGQGKRKSTFIRILAGDMWFTELHGDVEKRKEMVEQMQNSWIVELAELSAINKGQVESIKAFISGQSDKVRLSYMRRAADYKRQNIFIGSTNDKKYLKDTTGNRRFWPIECMTNEIDTERLQKNISQLWAEALFTYRKMRMTKPHGNLPLYLTDQHAAQEAMEIQDSRRVESMEETYAGQILDWVDKPVPRRKAESEGEFDDLDAKDDMVVRDCICLSEIWTDCLGNDPRSYKNPHPQILGKAMSVIDEEWIQSGLYKFPKYGRQKAYWRAGSKKAPGYRLRSVVTHDEFEDEDFTV